MDKNKHLVVLLLLIVSTILLILVGNYTFKKISPETQEAIKSEQIEHEKNKKEKEEKRKKAEKIKKPLLVLTFDDGFETDYSIVYPMLSERGVLGTSFVNGGHVNNGGGKLRRMNWDQLRELESNGWDIQSHTYTHQRLSELNEKEVNEEFFNDDKAFEENGLALPEHTAYPYGDHNSTVKSIGKDHRKTLRRTNPSNSIPYNNWDNIDFHNLSARITDIHHNNSELLEERKDDIDQTIENDGILIFYSHEFKKDVAMEYETQLEYYEELIDYAINKDIEIITMSEMYELTSKYQELIQ